MICLLSIQMTNPVLNKQTHTFFYFVNIISTFIEINKNEAFIVVNLLPNSSFTLKSHGRNSQTLSSPPPQLQNIIWLNW